MNDSKYIFECELNNPEQVKYRIFAPDSKVKILYWFSRDDIPKQQKEDLMRALVHFDDNCGGFYRYRAYLLAAEALSYFPESSFGDAIVKQLLDWSYLYFGWQLFPQPLVEAARNTLLLTDKIRVIKAFEILLRNTPSRLTLQSAAVKLGEFDAGNKMAIAALILLLDVTKDKYKLRSICRSIGKIGVGNQAAISVVVDLMETTEDKNLCCEGITTLGKIGCGNQTVTIALEKFLQINRGDRICSDAAKALLLIDSGNEVAKDALVFLLESTQEMYLLIKAVEFLQEIDSQNQAAIKVLSERLKSCKDDCYRAEIAASVGRFDRNQSGIKEALIEVLENSQEYSLLNLDNFALFSDNESYLYRRVIMHLVQLYPDNKDVINSLISFIEKNLKISIDGCLSVKPNIAASSLAIYALRNIFFHTNFDFKLYQKFLDTSIRYLQVEQGKQPIFEIGIAEAILQFEPDNQIAMSILIGMVQKHIYIGTRAAAILVNFESHYQQAINILVESQYLENIGILLEYIKLFPDNYLNKIAKEGQTTRVVIDEAINLGIQNLLNWIEEDKQLLFDSEYKILGYMSFEEKRFCQAWENLDSIKNKGYFPQIVKALKGYLTENFYYSNSSRYDEVYQLMWDYSENMSYQDFYQAWHG